ncbi:MAG: leucyl/phenylalanyl-tRNA--protein transferase [Phycisphaerae bacterium]|nr:leucyl/phenylalanyl-tRNA--protein transferase [Phycisphaerae bacterium]
MADDDGQVFWCQPPKRAILPLDGLKVSRSLRATIRKGVYECRADTAFREVIEACADRPGGTWISQEIRSAYLELHRLGFAHSVESWCEGTLAGGLYGVALGGAFFGESMFHRRTDASKVALVNLADRLVAGGYVLLDAQFQTDHLRSLGAIEIPRREYERRLRAALKVNARFPSQT